jgi:hypothetical protein
MTHPHSQTLTRRQALARILASVALGLGLAAVIIVHGVSTSSARAEPAPPGTAASQLTAMQRAPIDKAAPSAVQAGLADGSADADAIRLLGSNIGGGGLSLYAALRSNGGACNALAAAKGGVGTTCTDTLQDGISIAASDADGWLVYGFAADGVVAVDVVVGGKPQPAVMLANGYAFDLGAADLAEATALVVHHADGTAVTVNSGLQAPPTA